MVKSILVVSAAAVMAAAFVGFVPPPAPAVAAFEAATPNAAGPAQAAATAPTAVQPDQSGCTGTWPYYEQSCLRNSRQPNGNARVVRVIAEDKSVVNRSRRAPR